MTKVRVLNRLMIMLTLVALPVLSGTATAAAPVWTGTGCTDPAQGIGVNAPMASWVWTGETLYFQPGGALSQYSTSALPIAFPTGNYPWVPGVDETAPLLWYAQHVPGGAATLGAVFASCQAYTPDLLQTMQAEHFAPSDVGGVNPVGITAPATTTSTQQTQPTPAPNPTPPTTQTHSAQPSGSPQTTSQSGSPTAPQYPTSVTSQPTLTAQQIANIVQRDRQLIAAQGGGQGQISGSGTGTGSGGRSTSWWSAMYGHLYGARYRVAAVAAVIALLIGGIVWWRRPPRRRPEW